MLTEALKKVNHVRLIQEDGYLLAVSELTQTPGELAAYRISPDGRVLVYDVLGK